VTLAVAAALLIGATGVTANAKQDANATDYVGSVEVVRVVGRQTRPADTVEGKVFNDANRDARSQGNEDGIADVMVSNGREVVLTDEDGRYELPAYEGMTVFVTKPAAYNVPVDEGHFAQFFYHHLPEGSPDLRFGGLPPSGPLPQAINFPMAEATIPDELNCAVIGDTQTYSNQELGFLRDGVVADLAARDDLDGCGALIVGDVAGDDLGVYPRLKTVMRLADVPVRAVPGNHDLDFDATTDEHSADTYRREIGPEYYSYDIGDVHFVGLDNVRYPCTPDVDNADGKHEFCDDPEEHPTYNGVIGEEQMTWLANDLAHVPEDKLIVIATHIPLVGYIDMESTKHQTDDVTELYALLEGRPALSVSGHAQTIENLQTGDSYAGWQDAVGVQTLPFPHTVVGAASGSWWTGDLDTDGIPEALQREGAPAGYLNLELDGNTYEDTYRATGLPEDDQMSLSISSPFFRDWYATMAAWQADREAQEEPDFRTPPPVNINDLGDTNLLTKADLADSSYLMANVWNGATDTQVTVQIDDHEPAAATRTQEARGEGAREGAEFADPYAIKRQLQVARYSLESTSGDDRAQGWEAFRGDKFGPGPAQPLGSWLWADQSHHLWKLPLPAALPVGPHTATVRVSDADGRQFEEILNFEVVKERPPHFFRTEVFEDTEVERTKVFEKED
jgi:hypothetical protein